MDELRYKKSKFYLIQLPKRTIQQAEKRFIQFLFSYCTPDSKMAKRFASISISANRPYGKVNVGQV
ncbi:Uncharacterised protein [Myroides odoratus]|uniref:Uncharacterized protein n=1 Tax=Myroides odoratus TaxID=256 RepID=A0A378RJH0_MYROD|nr:Uncharacterised protein [Myroides odoratus]